MKKKSQSYHRKKYHCFCILLICIGIILFTGVSTVSANEISLDLSPPLTKIEAHTPTDIRTPFTITNQTDQSVKLTIELKPFVPSENEDGQITYLSEKEASTSGYLSFLKQVQIVNKNVAIDSIELGPEQKKKLLLRINLPEGVPPADYYFSIIFTTKEKATTQNAEETSIKFRGGIASNVLLSVNPEKRHNAVIEAFDTDFYHQHGPISFTLRVNNPDKHMISPKGVMLITNMFGQTIGRIEIPETNVLAGSTRALVYTPKNKTKDIKNDQKDPSVLWNEKVLLGYYRAQLSLAISESGPVYTRTIDFIVIPMKILLSTLLSLMIILLIILRIKKKLKSQ